MRAQINATKFGLDLEVFWRMTPYQFGIFLHGARERQKDERARDRFMVFYTAAGGRIKDLRDLPGLMDGPSKKKPSQGVDDDAIMRHMRLYKAARELKKGKE